MNTSNRIRAKACALACLLLGACLPAGAGEAADRIYVDARVWTGDPQHPEAQALAVRGERLLAVGTNAQVRRLASAGTEIVDLHGARVVPGFNDAHWHFLPEEEPALYGANSLAELRRRLQLLAQQNPGTGWLTSLGWAYADFPDKLPHRRHLDDLFPDRPVWISARDAHMALANSVALRLAGITRDTPDPEGGRIERDANGEPTGELKEHAMRLVARLVPRLDDEQAYAALLRTLAAASSQGITSVQNLQELKGPAWHAVQRALREGRLTVRMYTAVEMQKAPSAQELARISALRAEYRGTAVNFGVVKSWLDGTIDARTAFMRAPFVGGGNGISNWTPEELRTAALAYDRVGFQLAMHTCGDAATDEAITAAEQVALRNGRRDRRTRIEHIDLAWPDALARMRRLGMIASSQPNFAYPDPTNLANYAVLLGPERIHYAQAFAMIDAAGVSQPFGSDYPVSPMNVLEAMRTAVTRQTVEGTPAGGWLAHQKIDVQAALRHFTYDGAYASFSEHDRGRLTAGRYADFTVLSADIVADNGAALAHARVVRTIVGGRETFRADAPTAAAGEH